MTAELFVRHQLQFANRLREKDFRIGSDQVMDALTALTKIRVERRQDVCQALRSIYVTRKDDIEQFDDIFENYWMGSTPPSNDLKLTLPKLAFSKPGSNPQTGMESPQVEMADEDENAKRRLNRSDVLTAALKYSPLEVIRYKDFAEYTDEEKERAKKLFQQLDFRISLKKTRRLCPDDSGHKPDFRRTFLSGIRQQGEFRKLKMLRRKTKPRQLAILCDISGSMERYARMLLHFMYAIYTANQPVETFVFGTRLTRITHKMRSRDIDAAVSAVSGYVTDWAGGTRIGASVREFNFSWMRRVIRSSATVLIISDGWDRGEIPLLKQEISRLSRSCHRIVWLNPLLGMQDYQPMTAGIRAVIPHIDDFLPVHNLESLLQLKDLLGNLR